MPLTPASALLSWTSVVLLYWILESTTLNLACSREGDSSTQITMRSGAGGLLACALLASLALQAVQMDPNAGAAGACGREGRCDDPSADRSWGEGVGCVAVDGTPVEGEKLLDELLPRDRYSQSSSWQNDAHGRCWCLPARKWTDVRAWFKTRVVHLDNYDSNKMHLWVEGDEAAARATLSGAGGSGLPWFVSWIPGLQSHDCSPFGHQQTCLVRRSPFERLCVAIKARPEREATLAVQDNFLLETLLPLVLAAFLFLAAPSAAHSLWCYYLTGSMIMMVCCVGVVVFFSLRRFLGSRQAVVLGLLSWGGAVQQSVVHSMLLNKWVVSFAAICALIGFLIAYNYPPNERGMFSIQVIIQFVSVFTVFLSAPSLAREGVAWAAFVALAYLFTALHPTLFSSHRLSGLSTAGGPQRQKDDGRVAGGGDQGRWAARAASPDEDR